MTGQYSLAEARRGDSKIAFPAAVVLWARVSPNVDKRLAENLTGPLTLRPDEWRSGDILWLVEAVGDTRVVHGLLKQLAGSAFKDKDVKARTNGGRLVVRPLRETPAEHAAVPKQ